MTPLGPKNEPDEIYSRYTIPGESGADETEVGETEVDEANPVNNGGSWWLGAIISPYICFAIGFVVIKSAPRDSSDWLGGGIMGMALIALAAAFICWLYCTVNSHKCGEKYVAAAYIGLLPFLFAVR